MDFEKLVKDQITRIDPYIPGRLFEKDSGVLKLASNENLLGPSEKVLERIREHAELVNYYPDSDARKVRADLAEFHEVDPERILMGNGAVEHLYKICTAFIGAGDTVLFPWPSFAIFQISSTIQDADIERVPLDDRWQFDFDAIIERCEKTDPRLVFLANPNNPTGSWFGEEQLRRLLDAVDSEETIVMLDEAYAHFVDADDYPDSFELQKDHDNLLILRTYAKIFGLAGLRVGALFADPELIDMLNRVREPFNCNRLAQVALREALKDEEYYEKSRRLVIRDREYIMDAFDERGIDYVPTQTNFLFFDSGVDGEKLNQRMIEEKVTLRPMKGYDLDSWFRASVPSDLDKCDRFLAALDKCREELINQGHSASG